MEYWILQHNPNMLNGSPTHPDQVSPNIDYWHISYHVNDISINDMAFIWYADSTTRGIYNVAEIVSVPPHSSDVQRQIELLQQSDDPYWNDPEERARLRQKPTLLIERHYHDDFSRPIFVNELRREGFGNLPIINMWRHGIYSLDPNVGQQLLQYIQRTRG